MRTESAIVLNQASAAQTANGNSVNVAVGSYTELAVDVNITAIAGTSPTLNIYLDRLGADGVWYTIWSPAQVTATTGAISTSIGLGGPTNASVGGTVRLRWVVGGTSPSYTFSASIIGK